MNRILRAALAAVFTVCLVTGAITPTALPPTQAPAFAEHLITESAAPAVTPVPTPVPTPTPTPTATPEPTPTPTPVPTPTPFANGASGDDVKTLQSRLARLGFFTGKADGIFGPKTEAAVKQYQQYRYDQYVAALPTPVPTPEPTPTAVPTATPVPTAEPTPDPNATATPEPTRDPSLPDGIPAAIGSRDTETDASVTQLQQKLIDMNYLFDIADGVYGQRTAAAVKAFQAANRLPETGTADGPTWHALNSADAVIAPEPTPTPYAPDGVISDLWKDDALNGEFEVYQEHMESGSEGAEVTRLQTRLAYLWYYTAGIDGQFGSGTAGAVKYFQKRNSLEQTGVADEATQRLLFSDDAVKSDRPPTPYKLIVDVSDQKVYAYEWVDGEYSRLVRTMICSTGLKDTPTPLGTFRAGGACGRWYYFKKFDCWAQYAYRINGPILFHSVIYSEKDTSTLRKSSLNNLGRRASHGCIRLKVEDAKWIYNNCPSGTTVTVRN